MASSTNMKALLALVCLATAVTALPALKSQTLSSTGVAIKAINEVAGAPSTTCLPETRSLVRWLGPWHPIGLGVIPARNPDVFAQTLRTRSSGPSITAQGPAPEFRSLLPGRPPAQSSGGPTACPPALLLFRPRVRPPVHPSAGPSARPAQPPTRQSSRSAIWPLSNLAARATCNLATRQSWPAILPLGNLATRQSGRCHTAI